MDCQDARERQDARLMPNTIEGSDREQQLSACCRDGGCDKCVLAPRRLWDHGSERIDAVGRDSRVTRGSGNGAGQPRQRFPFPGRRPPNQINPRQVGPTQSLLVALQGVRQRPRAIRSGEGCAWERKQKPGDPGTLSVAGRSWGTWGVFVQSTIVRRGGGEDEGGGG
jgi:hypothetical protein